MTPPASILKNRSNCSTPPAPPASRRSRMSVPVDEEDKDIDPGNQKAPSVASAPQEFISSDQPPVMETGSAVNFTLFEVN